jgi:hypothetical protein
MTEMTSISWTNTGRYFGAAVVGLVLAGVRWSLLLSSSFMLLCLCGFNFKLKLHVLVFVVVQLLLLSVQFKLCVLKSKWTAVCCWLLAVVIQLLCVKFKVNSVRSIQTHGRCAQMLDL